MYKKHERGDDLIAIYSRDDLVTEILEAYEAGKDDGLGRNGVISRMATVIKEQMVNGDFVSRHLMFTAADVRSRGMSEEQFDVLTQAVRSVGGARLIDERDTPSPHIHLNL